eukprot:426271-Pyramimonas_sp.AAC.1
MDPSNNIDTTHMGVGCNREVPEIKLSGKILEGGCRNTRATNRTPLRWHVSSAAQLRKNAKPGPVGRCTVHVLPTLGEACYSGLLRAPPT